MARPRRTAAAVAASALLTALCLSEVSAQLDYNMSCSPLCGGVAKSIVRSPHQPHPDG